MTNKTTKLNSSVQNDVKLKEFWRNNAHFADLFNAAIFNGEQFIKPENLYEMDTDTSTTISSENYNESIKRNRDVVKKMYNGIEYNILGLEFQDKTHYAMPLRTMTYDALGYIKEYNNIRSIHKLNKNSFSSSEEFLSGISRTDRFHPIITLVLYYGESPWDGPLCLSDMMIPMPDNIKKMFSDYKLNLIQILDSDKYTFYNEDVKNVFNIINKIYNKDIQSLFKEYNSKNVDYDVIELISIITATPKLLEFCNKQEQGGKINMCKAFEELENEWTNNGLNKGLSEGLSQGKQLATQHAIISMLELGLTKEQILTKYSEDEFNSAVASHE